MSDKLNPLPPYTHGLWRVKRQPYPLKERWPEGAFGDRWRALKARLRGAPVTDATAFGPAPLLEGTAAELPGFDMVPTADTRGAKPWTA